MKKQFNPSFQITIAMLLQFVWMTFLFIHDDTRAFLVTLIPLVTLAFLQIHFHLRTDFFSEIKDVFYKEPEHEVDVHGEVAMKAKENDRKIGSMNFWQTIENRIGISIAIWILISYLSVKNIGAFQGVWILLAGLSTWAAVSRYLWQWVLISAVTALLTIFKCSSAVEVVVTASSFFLFYTCYRQLYLQNVFEANFSYQKLFISYSKPFAIFLFFFLLSAIFLPDQKELLKQIKLKNKIVEKIVKHQSGTDKQSRSTNSSAQAGSSKDGHPSQSLGQKANNLKMPNLNSQNTNSSKSENEGGDQPEGQAEGQSEASSSGDHDQKISENELEKLNPEVNKHMPDLNVAKNDTHNQSNSQNHNKDQGSGIGSADKAGQTPGKKAGAEKESGSNDGTASRESTDSQTITQSHVEHAEPVKQAEVNQKVKDEVFKIRWMQKIEFLEKVFKLILVLAALWLVWKILAQPSDKTRERKKKVRRARRQYQEALRILNKLRAQNFNTTRDEVIANYHALLSIHEALGFAKMQWQTPNQFKDALLSEGFFLKNETQALTKYFNFVYYGENELKEEDRGSFVQIAKKIRGIQLDDVTPA